MLPDIKMSPTGLWTGPSEMEVPSGALRRAEEIVIRRKGRAEPRPGFDKIDTFGTDPDRMLEFNGDYLGVEAAATTVWASDDSEVKDEDGNDLAWDAYAIQGVEARKNLYLTTSDVLRKITAAGGAEATRTGAPVPAIYGEQDGSGESLLANSRVSYRAVTLRRDVNLLDVRSAPSNRTIVTNTGGSAVKTEVKVALHKNDDFKANDIIELYRSLNSESDTVMPFDEHFFVMSKVLTGTDVSNGYISFFDNVKDEEMLVGTVSLYTNEAIGGREAAHIRPPAAKTVALFNGSLFLGDLKYPAEEIFTLRIEASNLNNTADGIGQRTITSGMTNGSAAVTVASTTGLKAGMVVFSDSASDWASGSAYVRILSVDSSTDLTLSRNWDSTTGNHIITYVDSIRIGNVYHPIGLGGQAFLFSVYGALDQLASAFGPATQDADPSITAELLSLEEFTISDGPRALRLQTFLPSDSAPLVYATHGSEYSPALNEPGGVGIALPQDILPSAVAWSNNLEPEHFQLANIEYVGSQIPRVMRLLPLKKGLFIFKKEATYQGSGAGAESGFRFDMFNEDVRLLFPEACCVVREKAYAWGDQGVFEMDESGVLDISNAIENSLKPVQFAIQPDSTTALGAWMVSNRKDKEFLLSVPVVGNLTKGERIYVFNQETGTWVNWFVDRDTYCGMYREADGYLYIRDGADDLKEYPAGTSVDDSIPVTIASFDDTQVTISAGSDWDPVVGDLLIRSDTTMRILDVDGLVLTTDVAPPSTGSSTAYVAFTSAIEFIACSAKNPGDLKIFGEGSLWFEDPSGLWFYELDFVSSISSTLVSQTFNIAPIPLPSGAKAESYRFATPTRHSRTTRLYPTIRIRCGGANWALGACMVKYRTMSSRVRFN